MPNLIKLGPSGYLKFNNDFREIYVTVVVEWLSANGEYLLNTFFSILDII